jgi:hypothetical protein
VADAGAVVAPGLALARLVPALVGDGAMLPVIGARLLAAPAALFPDV